MILAETTAEHDLVVFGWMMVVLAVVLVALAVAAHWRE
jgi:hypothetical protein